ncbi:sodium- and chloride-dependent glycine transporter 2-like [Ruditapes philippinarum]|uniref:sodium- and chloride-dependent glycine transporter 2-like n=1 Tax=Ruditapes philippinarum TaxID=129788 RepID=UPI00295AD094|nr:sodium- and chloride-dependent glycine transporter 2-like [Ruditapes philippinarum]
MTIFALIELLVMTFIYGVKRVDDNMREMTGKGVPILFKIAWCVTTPILLVVTLGFTVYTYKPPSYGRYEYEPWHISLGWCISSSSLVPIPLYLFYRLNKTPGTILERFKVNLRPNEKWGPQESLEQEAIQNGKLLEDDIQTRS